MIMVRCPEGHALGERQGARMFIRRVGLILMGGTHTWTCEKCGSRMTIDLDAVDSPAMAGAQCG